MHELGILIDVIQKIETFAKQNQVTKIETVVLQIGELSSMIPRYIEACYPAAVEGTLLCDTKLKIEVLPGMALCKSCNKVYNVKASNAMCPHCGCDEGEVLCGREFIIKEIVAC